MLNYTILQSTQDSHMFDTCAIHTVTTSGYDEYGQPITSYTTISGISCGVEMTGGTTQYKGQIFPTPVDAILRLPIDTQITIVDTVTITERNGESTSEDYSVISVPRKGTSAIRVNLKRIEI